MPDHALGSDETAVEKSDIHVGRVLAVAGVILLALLLVIAMCWGLLRLWQMPVGAGPNAPPPQSQSAAHDLQSAPQVERAAFLAQKEKLLHSYQWLDRKAGVARIPIEVAMDLLTAHGTLATTPAHAQREAKP